MSILPYIPTPNTPAHEITELENFQVFRSDGIETAPPTSTTTTGSRKAPISRLDEFDPRFCDWRVKLGALLKQELSPTPHEGSPWLMQFPKGYWLYEKGKATVVVGYPVKGRVYKTPQEFALHILWLLSDSSDRRDCTCMFCSVLPDQVKSVVAPAGSAAQTTAVMAPVNTAVVGAVTTANNAVSTPPDATSGKISTIKARKSNKPSPAATAMPRVYNTSIIPVNPPLFRTGELVWYSHESSWRLGLITQSEVSWHRIAPIGHTSSPHPQINKAPGHIRPFLAFSVPAVSAASLKGLTYDEVPWAEKLGPLLKAGQLDAVESLLLDASKLAALKINRSFSFFNRVGSNNGTTSYRGIFLGAERLQVDDVLRITQPVVNPPGTPVDVMSLNHFWLKGIYTMEASPGTLFFHGSVIRLMPANSKTTPPTNFLPVEIHPQVLLDEAVFRNSSSSAATWKWKWAIVEENTWRKEPDIKGRFYAMPKLGPILMPAQMKGPRDKISPALNGRVDAVLAGKNFGGTSTRFNTVVNMIPIGTGPVFKWDEKDVQFENDV